MIGALYAELNRLIENVKASLKVKSFEKSRLINCMIFVISCLRLSALPGMTKPSKASPQIALFVPLICSLCPIVTNVAPAIAFTPSLVTAIIKSCYLIYSSDMNHSISHQIYR